MGRRRRANWYAKCVGRKMRAGKRKSKDANSRIYYGQV